MKKAAITGVFILCGMIYATFGQDAPVLQSTYQNGIGIRAGGPSGITFKHFRNDTKAIELIAAIWPSAFSITGLYEIHADAFNVPGMKWFYGTGGHLQVYERHTTNSSIRSYSKWDHRDDEDNGFGLGIDGIFGLDYKILPIPISVSTDVKPYIEITTSGKAYFGIDPAISLRYAIGTP